MADGSNGRRPPRPRAKWPTVIWGGHKSLSRPFGTVMSPGLKLPTQSQMADGNLEVPDLKVCVQNMKLFFTQTSEHFQTLENFFQCFFFFDKTVFSDNFFSKNFSLLSRPLHSIKVICKDKLSKKKTQNGQKWLFQIFSDNFPKKTGINLEQPKLAVPNFFNNFSQKDWYKFRMAKNGHFKFI